MAFNPSSTIYLCNVPIDNTYQNQIYFPSKTAQHTYFSNKVQKTFSNYLTVRKTLPDGSMVSSVKVECNIDELYNCNYMYYQNANHGTRFFYAFITKLIYINEGTTEIRFETDVYQTWVFDVALKESYVVREHSVTDGIGDNIIPEKFNFDDYRYYDRTAQLFGGDNPLLKVGYLVATTEWIKISETAEDIGQMGATICGIYQGLHYWYFPDNVGVGALLKSIDKDVIVSICVIPQFAIPSGVLSDSTWGRITQTTKPQSKTYTLDSSEYPETLDSYTPKNNKLFTSPFYKLVIVNHAGEKVELSLEDFAIRATASFKLYADISLSPSASIIPLNYKGITENIEYGVTIAGYPQCSCNTDTFKLWLAKNQFGVALDVAGGVGSIIAGAAVTAGSGGAGSAIGVSQMIGGATAVLNTINSVYQASREPNQAKTGAPKNHLLTTMGKNVFGAYFQTLKYDYAKTIDDFFTMYGYQTNCIKVPNVSSRPYFNYVQTVDCNIVGGIPDDDMRQLKAIYNNGVTLWKSNATVGDYSVDNSPS